MFSSNGISNRVKTTRRLDAEGPSLAKRRRWFAEGDGDGAGAGAGAGTGENGAGAGTGTGAGAETHGDWFKALPPEAQREIEDLRRENAKKRDDLKKLADQQRIADEKRLTEQQEWQKLAETRAVELERLKPLEERFSALEETTKATNAKRVAAIPEHMRGLVPANYAPFDLRDWLDANAAVFAPGRSPNMNAGAQGDGGGNGQKPKLTPEQQASARRFGNTDEDFIKNM